MNFKEWLLLELRVPPDFQSQLIKNRMIIDLHVDKDGNIKIGFGKPYYRLEQRTKRINIIDGDPHSDEFKKLIKSIKPYISDIEDWHVYVVNLSHYTTGKIKLRRSIHGEIEKDVNVDRKVSYYLKSRKKSRTEHYLPNYLYHGTSTELWYDGISKKGLLPRKQSGAGGIGSYGASGQISTQDVVYLASSPDAATKGAAIQSAERHGGYPVILRIDTNSLYPNKFVGDEDIDFDYEEYIKKGGNKSFPQFSINNMGTVGYAGKIPPSAIEPVMMTYGERETENLYRGRWLPWHDVERTEHAITKKLKNRNISTNESYWWGLLDADIIDKDSKIIKPDFTDEEIREIFKNSSWMPIAQKISRDLNYFGMRGIKSLKDMRLENYNLNHNDFNLIEMLIDSGLVEKNRDESLYVLNSFSDRYYLSIIKLAKELDKRNMTYQELVQQLNKMKKKWKYD